MCVSGGKTPEAYAFLREFLTTEILKELLPDMATFEIEPYELGRRCLLRAERCSGQIIRSTCVPNWLTCQSQF
ncbi:MAG: hypothetical protein HN580_21225 [Deltaproteobacteria bacterium]|nr:hypothetical protein [Deltaproteobacteria bacterium]MBT6499215.1 hypothetical protein [Deltaproteobacteria bacterium]MBT6615091.1 hypothetical protein [Deltaproteobacteria bacterium]MBT7154221.1 hypothetical protein [Deltaproteobacteria bacterium]MBT7712925.1 hypothetical protein [Deltaproteobacteria bacterium]